MARLNQMISNSLVENLGLGEALQQRQRESEQLGQVTAMRGQVGAERIKRKSRQKRGTFETIGTILGGVGGFIVGGPAGAQVGARAGQALGGELSGQAADPRASVTSGRLIQATDMGSSVMQQQAAQQQAAQRQPVGQVAKPERGTVVKQGGRVRLVSPTTGEVIKDMGPDIAAKDVNLANQGLFSVRQIHKIIDPVLAKGETGTGLLDTILGAKSGPLAKTKSRQLRGSFRNAIDTILRSRTGAVISDDEFEAALESWGLQVGDSAAVVNKKISDLETMLNLMGGKIDPATEEGKAALDLELELIESMEPHIEKEPGRVGRAIGKVVDTASDLNRRLAEATADKPPLPSGVSESDVNNARQYIRNNPNSPDAIKLREALQARGVDI